MDSNEKMTKNTRSLTFPTSLLQSNGPLNPTGPTKTKENTTTAAKANSKHIARSAHGLETLRFSRSKEGSPVRNPFPLQQAVSRPERPPRLVAAAPSITSILVAAARLLLSIVQCDRAAFFPRALVGGLLLLVRQLRRCLRSSSKQP